MSTMTRVRNKKREQAIKILKKKGWSLRQIAKVVKVSHTAISKALKRV